jgi:hypothetical protein
MKHATAIALLLALPSLTRDAQGSTGQHLDALRTATLYTITVGSAPIDRAPPLQAYLALKGTLTLSTIKLAAQGATTAGQLYMAALACHLGDRRLGEALIAKLDERTAVLTAASGNLVYRNVKALAEPGSPQNPCPITPILAGE